ncbi:MAG: hypothetical protein ABR899_04775 [Candidatus Krumholzibacteriaceae bacterium]|jgi:hypothetical protein
MNMTNARLARPLAVFALCVLAALPLSSCLFKHGGSLSPLNLAGERSNAPLTVAARFATAGDDAPGFFLKLMPDSGVAAVRVAIRNDGTAPLVIHSANGLKTGPGFEGFALSMNGATYLPLHPKEVVARILGANKAGRYKRHGVVGYMLSTFVAPVAVYFIYNDIEIGRFYRPLFNRSLYPALEDGMFAPVRIEPKQEVSAYLYFALPKRARNESCDLLVRACAPIETRYSLKGTDFRFSRDELPLTGDPSCSDGGVSGVVGGGAPGEPPHQVRSCDAPYGFIFALGENRRPGGQGLYFAHVRSINPASDSLWTFVAPVGVKSAEIADASCIGSLAACAVNFKSKSKVYLVQCGEAPGLFREQSFSRSVRRVFLHTGGAFVVTDDGVCHPFDGLSHTWGRGVKLGTDVEETGLIGGRLFAFLKNGTLNVFGPSGETPFELLERHALRHGANEVVGLLEGDIVLLERGKATRGDTISIFDAGGRAVKFRRALPGKVSAACSDGSSLLMQFEEGTLVRVVHGPLSSLDVTEAGYLPFQARALKSAPHGFIAVGRNGVFAVGSIGSINPGTGGAVEVSVKVQ